MKGRADRTRLNSRPELMWLTSTSRPGALYAAAVLAGANHGQLMDACQGAGVTLGAFDARILAWLASVPRLRFDL